MSFSSLVNRNDYTGNGSVSSYSYTYKIFDEDHLLVTVATAAGVETTLTITTDYTVSGVGASGGGAITLVSAGQAWLTGGNLTNGYTITIRRVVPHTQVVDIRNQGSFYPEVHEDEFDKLVMADQQQQDEIDRSARMPETIPTSVFDPTFPASLPDNPGACVIVNPAGDGFDLGPTADAIEAAQAEATAAAASAAAALVSENAAAASETAAGVSEANAAATLASAFYRDVVYITSAASPVTIAQADNGKLYSCNTSGGAIVINLPQQSGITMPFNISFKLATAGNNLTINRAGTDTIDGATSKVLSVANTGCHIIGDTSASPDDWTSIDLNTVGDGAITTAKLNTQVVSGATTVTAVLADSVLIADASDSGNVKKSLISDIKNDKVRSVTTTDSPTTADETLILSGASFTVTLFAASGNAGKILNFIHNGTSLTQVYTIDGNASETIGGSTTVKMHTNGQVLRLFCDGSNWLILDSKTGTEWTDAGTNTVTATTSNPTKASGITVDKIYWRRVGKNAEIRIEYVQSNTTSAAAGSGDYLWQIPSNMTIDTTTITPFTTVVGINTAASITNVVGGGQWRVSAANYDLSVVVYDTTKVRLYYLGVTDGGMMASGAGANFTVATFGFGVYFSVPIVDWLP
jgi:hypothetical protein